MPNQLVSGQTALIGSDEGAIAVRGEGPLIAEEWSADENTLLWIEPGMAADGDIVIVTADQWGPFSVTSRLWESAPGEPSQEWEDIVEFSVTSSSGLALTALVDNDPIIDLVEQPGTHRIRVSARGRLVEREHDEDDIDSNDEEPLEWYLVEAWPSPAVPHSVLRLTSPYAQRKLNPLPALIIPEGEDGLAAARRIGRDADRRPGARALSGELGSITVERSMRGTRRKLFRLCAHVHTWSHAWLPTPSWSFGGGPGPEYALGVEQWAYAHDHPDQLSGSTGAIRTSFIEVDKPQRAVRAWNWIQRSGERGPSPFIPGIGVLAEDSTLVVSLEQTKRGDDPWTTVRFQHDGLPVEWLDDMRTYWGYQLSIADHAGFGLPK